MHTPRFDLSRFSYLLCLLLLAGSSAGCGDDGDGDIGGDPVDAAPIDAVQSIDGPVPTATGFVVAGDFVSGTGIASTIAIPSLEVTPNVIAGVASDDPVVRRFGDTLYIVNRYQHDNITLVDANTMTFIDQISTGNGSNPQDVAVVGDKLYVPALDTVGVVTIDGQGVMATIDLGNLDPFDGMPDCNSAYLVGDRLVVTCGLLQDFVAVGPGRVVVIDTNDDSVVDDFALATANPIGLLRPTPSGSRFDGSLLMATYDFNDLTVGCVERIAVDPNIESAGCVVQNTILGGYATGLAYGPDDVMYIAVTSGFDAQGAVAEVVAYQAVSGSVTGVVSEPGERTFDVALCPTGHLLFADANGGIRVYDAEGNQLTDNVLDIGLPPSGNGMVCW